jgi:DNA-binding transcriptional LysR family regulator
MPDLNPQAALERGEVDLAIGNLPDMAPGFYQQRLFREHYVAITRPDHPLLGGAMNAERFAVAHHAVVVPHGTGHSAVEQALVNRGLACARRAAGAELPGVAGHRHRTPTSSRWCPAARP